MPAPLVLGVDGGNTKTVALVAGADGTILGAGRGGRSDIYNAVSEAAALAALDDAVRAAPSAAGAAADRLEAAVFSLAGADWPEDFALLDAAVRARGYGRTTTVVNDAIGALRAGSPDGTGVVIACGTGVATGARNAAGRVWHSSFWQESNGGYVLGSRALQAVFRAELGVGPPTLLTERALAFFGEPTPEAVLHRLTRRGTGWSPMASAPLAPVVLDEAARGDAVALGIVEALGSSLGDYALAAARAVGIAGHPFHLVLTGGVFRHPAPEFAAAVVARVRRDTPGVVVHRSRFEPTVGALLLAFEAAGIPVDDALLKRLAATLPPAALFAT